MQFCGIYRVCDTPPCILQAEELLLRRDYEEVGSTHVYATDREIALDSKGFAQLPVKISRFSSSYLYQAMRLARKDPNTLVDFLGQLCSMESKCKDVNQ